MTFDITYHLLVLLVAKEKLMMLMLVSSIALVVALS